MAVKKQELEFCQPLGAVRDPERLSAAKELAVLSDRAAWIRNVCEEILPEWKAWMERIQERLNDGEVARVIDGLKLHCDRCRKRGLPVGSGTVESA